MRLSVPAPARSCLFHVFNFLNNQELLLQKRETTMPVPLDTDEATEMLTWSGFVETLHNVSANTSTKAANSVIGKSEQGEPIYGFVFGEGPCTVSLVAGAHADEPAGPNTLYRLVWALLEEPELYSTLLSEFRLLVIPHINPDGDAANASWIRKWPDAEAALSGMVRELPGRDVEFGYPGMRPENRSAAAFWKEHPPADLHISLHGMAFSEGFLLLINDEWEARTRSWREMYHQKMRESGLPPHDHDRAGEKGFNYMGPGFTSTPKGSAMRAHFEKMGDPATAAKFHMSSMEFQIERNPDVLCLVTELPLFLLPHSGNTGRPENYLAFRDARSRREPDLLSRFSLSSLPLKRALDLHWFTITSAMNLITGK